MSHAKYSIFLPQPYDVTILTRVPIVIVDEATEFSQENYKDLPKVTG